MKPPAMALLLPALMGVACGSASPPNPTQTSTPPAPATATSQACWPVRGGNGARTTIRDLQVTAGSNHDRIVIEFDSGFPSYEIRPNPTGPGSTNFVGSASGIPITVAGTYGLHLQLTGLAMPDSYPHGQDFAPDSAAIKEVRVIGDYEAIADVAIGLSAQRCPVVSTTAAPDRLIIDFPTP